MGVELATGDSVASDVFTVVGVVEDVPYGAPEEPAKPVIYTMLSDEEASVRFQEFWVIRHDDGEADDIVGLLHRLGGGIDEAYRIATPTELLDEQFAKRSLDAMLAMAGAFAFALALAGVANALARSVANQARQVGVRTSRSNGFAERPHRRGGLRPDDGTSIGRHRVSGATFRCRSASIGKARRTLAHGCERCGFCSI